MNRIFIILSFLFVSFLIQAKPVKIFGNAPEYKSYEITFYKQTDYITKAAVPVCSTKSDTSGNFSLEFEVDITTEIYTILGIYKAFIFVEPGKKYEVVLPPRSDKTLIHELNLYFEEEEMTLGIKESDEHELNYMIYSFNNEFETFVAESFNWLYIFKDKPTVDSVEKELDKKYPSGKNDFFDDYKYYKYAMLRYFVYERNRLYVTNKYLKDKPILYNNPAYMHFFTQLWNGYSTTEYSEGIGNKIYQSIIFGKSPTLAKKYFRESIALRDNAMCELILLIGLHDAFEKPAVYPRRALFQTLDSIALVGESPQLKIMAQNISKSAETLEIGDVPIKFSLPDKNKTFYSLEDFKGKFVYLNFCRSESYTCMQDYLLLQTIKETFPEDLEIVTVSYDESYDVFKSFLYRNKDYTWTFLYAEDEKHLIDNFNIKAIPAYFLIDPSGRLAVDPTLSPDQGFINQFGQIMNWKKRALESEKNAKELFYTPADE